MEELNLKGSICLTDIPKDLIVTANNGKKYLNILVSSRKEPSKYGKTHYIRCSKKLNDAVVYIGDLEPNEYEQPQPYPQPQDTPIEVGDDDLPF
jgi:hypothetical protein